MNFAPIALSHLGLLRQTLSAAHCTVFDPVGVTSFISVVLTPPGWNQAVHASKEAARIRQTLSDNMAPHRGRTSRWAALTNLLPLSTQLF